MTDPELEDLLRRYRPVGPSSDLRARILGDTAPVGRTWPWAVAAAMLLAAVCGLRLSTRGIYQDLRIHEFSAAASIDDLPALSSVIEGDVLLKQRLQEQLRHEQAMNRASPGPAGEAWH